MSEPAASRSDSYAAFLASKRSVAGPVATDAEVDLPSALFPFQRELVEWAFRRGRAAIFADCGLGKTPMQLAWADAVVRRTDKPVLILTPLAVAAQTVREGQKFGIPCSREPGSAIEVTNYERLHHHSPAEYAGVVC